MIASRIAKSTNPPERVWDLVIGCLISLPFSLVAVTEWGSTWSLEVRVGLSWTQQNVALSMFLCDRSIWTLLRNQLNCRDKKNRLFSIVDYEGRGNGDSAIVDSPTFLSTSDRRSICNWLSLRYLIYRKGQRAISPLIQHRNVSVTQHQQNTHHEINLKFKFRLGQAKFIRGLFFHLSLEDFCPFTSLPKL